jgi:hypothetical protein
MGGTGDKPMFCLWSGHGIGFAGGETGNEERGSAIAFLDLEFLSVTWMSGKAAGLTESLPNKHGQRVGTLASNSANEQC